MSPYLFRKDTGDCDAECVSFYGAYKFIIDTNMMDQSVSLSLVSDSDAMEQSVSP